MAQADSKAKGKQAHRATEKAESGETKRRKATAVKRAEKLGGEQQREISGKERDRERAKGAGARDHRRYREEREGERD